jgi:hypothetical protein
MRKTRSPRELPTVDMPTPQVRLECSGIIQPGWRTRGVRRIEGGRPAADNDVTNRKPRGLQPQWSGGFLVLGFNPISASGCLKKK